MKRCILGLFGLIGMLNVVTAQTMFTKEMGPAMNMDNSIATILMDLSTENKEYHMKGEKSKLDTLDRYYPNRLFGANMVYIKANYDQNSYNLDSYDATTKGQIIASFTPNGGDLMEPLKALTTNVESSKVWQRFFEKDTKNKNLNIILYVQKAPFELPANPRFTAAQVAEINKGLKVNFEQYEIRMGIETKSVKYSGITVEYIQVRSWVQLNEKEVAKKAKAIAARNAEYDRKQKAKEDLEKREMQGVKNTEAAIIKPNSPGRSYEVDYEALVYLSKRQDSLYNNYKSIINKYKAFSIADKLKNKQKDLKTAKEAFLAYKTNQKQFEAYLQKATFRREGKEVDLKMEEYDRIFWQARPGLGQAAFDYLGFSEIVEVFELKY